MGSSRTARPGRETAETQSTQLTLRQTCVPTQSLQHATVEPRAVGGPLVLTGPTIATWAGSRARLRWRAAPTSLEPYYASPISAKLRHIRARWTGERTLGTAPIARAVAWARELDARPAHSLSRVFHSVRTAPWRPRLIDFAHALATKSLPVGVATARRSPPDYTHTVDTCPLCDAQRDTVMHMLRDCPWHTADIAYVARRGLTHAAGGADAWRGSYATMPPHSR